MIDVDVTLTVTPQCRRDVDIKQFITNVTLGSSIVTQLCRVITPDCSIV